MIFLDTLANYALPGKFGTRKDWEEGNQFSGLHEFSRYEAKRNRKSFRL